MNNEDLKQQLVELLIESHVTMCPHSVADYLIDNSVNIQKTAKWVDVPDYGGGGWQISGKQVHPKYCSACGDTYSKAYTYCPTCGAKMNLEV